MENLSFSGVPPRPLPPWQSSQQLRYHLANLLDDAEILSALASELETLVSVKEQSCLVSNDKEVSPYGASLDHTLSGPYASALREALEGKGCEELKIMEKLALESAVALQQSVSSQVAPLLAVLQEQCTWEETSALDRLKTKRLKMIRNRKHRRKRRQLAAEALRKEKERYDQADYEADEWRAREIAKDIAKRKIEKMKAVAKKNAKEERQKLERELELVLIIEKLQELREMRIQRLKKQGIFFPEEDNVFMERVRAAVEEEERQAAAAADTSATAAAIANAEEAGKVVVPTGGQEYLEAPQQDATTRVPTIQDANVGTEPKDTGKEKAKVGTAILPHYVGNLPAEFYHYYYGSSVDMGALIEVRRFWDTFILPGGSRIPGHWVQPPPPADSVWASCLVNNKQPEG